MASALNRRIFGVAFVYVVASGLLLQWVVLPTTPWHHDHGLMAGGDWIEFHELALELSRVIAIEGWTAWVPRVEGQAPASVAAALYALTGIEHPSVLLPLHGLLYGGATVALFAMAIGLGARRPLAYLTLLPLFAFPSTAMIWGQIHKDIYSLAGTMFVLRFWVQIWLMIGQHRQVSVRLAFREILLLFLGMLLIVYVRPYLGHIVLIGSLLVTFILLAALFSRIHSILVLKQCKAIIPACLLMMTIGLVVQANVVIYFSVDYGVVAHDGAVAPSCRPWTTTRFLPAAIDQRLEKLSCARNGFRTNHPDAGSNIDVEIEFASAADVLKYVPRALQIGLLAPFPQYWFGDSPQPGGSMMRLFAIPEMLLLYIALPGLGLALLRKGFLAPTFMLIAFTILFVITHALTITNVGTLYRMRYPAVLIWIMLGIIGWSAWFDRLKMDPRDTALRGQRA